MKNFNNILLDYKPRKIKIRDALGHAKFRCEWSPSRLQAEFLLESHIFLVEHYNLPLSDQQLQLPLGELPEFLHVQLRHSHLQLWVSLQIIHPYCKKSMYKYVGVKHDSFLYDEILIYHWYLPWLIYCERPITDESEKFRILYICQIRECAYQACSLSFSKSIRQYMSTMRTFFYLYACKNT